MLGYHRWKHNRSTDLYARDAQAPALRGLVDMIRQIRDGQFAPDETRSGRFLTASERIVSAHVAALQEHVCAPASDEIVGADGDV
eukprot:807502-Amphidinium_carterae.1